MSPLLPTLLVSLFVNVLLVWLLIKVMRQGAQEVGELLKEQGRDKRRIESLQWDYQHYVKKIQLLEHQLRVCQDPKVRQLNRYKGRKK